MKRFLPLGLLLAAAPLRADVVTRGPYLQMGDDTAMTVRWRTDVPSTGRVRVGFSTATLGSPVDELSARTEHELRLTGLTAATTYFYEVGTSAGAALAGGSTDYFFVTPPAPGTAAPVRVWVLGDAGVSALGAPQNVIDQAAVRDAYLAFTGTRATSLWLMLGDNAYSSGTDAQYGAGVFDVYPSLLRSAVLWPTPGNHDYGSGGGNYGAAAAAPDYLAIFTLPTAGEAGGVASSTEAYYSFDHANIHFISLDSHHAAAYGAGAMLAWLQADLAATTQTWKVAFWHHPPYTHGSHDSDSSSDSCTGFNDRCRMTLMRQQAVPLLEAAGVDLVLSGHSHAYERSFLLNGHYGLSSTLTGAMKLDGGPGSPAAPYVKYDGGALAGRGSVYVVNGAGGQASGGALNHPAMYASFNELGSLVLDFDGDRLDGTFLGTGSNNVRDRFTVLKSPGARPPAAASPVKAYPNPFRPDRGQSLIIDGVAADAAVEIFSVAGEKVRELASDGTTSRVWDGRNASGKPSASGVYLAAARGTDGGKAVRKIALIR